MFNSLRFRLALSHTLPILIFVPLLGLVLLYQLEQRFFLNYVARELAVQGALIAEFPRTDPLIWSDPVLATAVINSLQQRIPAQMQFVDAATLQSEATLDRNQTPGAAPDAAIDELLLARAEAGALTWTIHAEAGTGERSINVAVPVFSRSGQVVGAVRLAQRLTDVQQSINGLRGVVLVTLFVGAILSLILGLLLARSLGAPLLQLSDGVARFRPSDSPERVPETGPTEMKALATNFNRLSERLHELEATRMLLLSGIVHELGRPLGSIKAAAQTIQVSQDPNLNQELAGGISEHVDRLQLQLDDLVLLGELEVRGITLYRESIFPAVLIHAQVQLFQEMANRNALTLTAEIPELPAISADPRRVEQILGNLIHNACKYTPSGGSIMVQAGVSSGQTEPSIWVAVTDSGLGIPIGEEERIFQLFYRNPSLRRIHQGLGIGLALARQLAEAHGGTISAQNQSGRGATFRLTLPIE